MPSSEYIDFPKVEDFAKKERLSIEKIFLAAGMGVLPLFIRVPNDLQALRIDLQRNDLAQRTELFHNPEDDIYPPVLLRLKPACCAELAKAKSVEASEFPYAVCLVEGMRHTQGGNVQDDTDRARSHPDYVTFVQVPPRQEMYPELLDTAKVCWRLFHPDTQDFSAFVPVTISPDMVLTRSDYSDRAAGLRRTGSRKLAGKSTDGYVNRHERVRCLLVEIAERVAEKNPNDCGTPKKLAMQIFDLRESGDTAELREHKPTFTLRWIEGILRERFEFVDGRPKKRRLHGESKQL